MTAPYPLPCSWLTYIWPRLLTLGGLGLLLSISACSPGPNSSDAVGAAIAQNDKRIDDLDVTKKQKQDAKFLVNALADGQLNQQLATVALQRAATPTVRNLAQRLLDQHIQINGEIKTLAGQKEIVLPTGIGDAQQETATSITALTGTAFDKKYCAAIVDGHKAAISDYEDRSKDAYDGDIRGFAAKYLPVLQQHFEQARQAQAEVDKLP